MNRPIKFRAWDKNNETMLYFQMGIIGFEQIRAKALDRLIDDDDLMQFTGLLDKNGVEIYEGDIINATKHDYDEIERPDLWHKYIVKFGEGVVDASDYEPYSVLIMGFFLEKIGGRRDDMDPSSIIEQERIEIIGNIYENPNLLNEKTT